jgi:hypothetical protein
MGADATASCRLPDRPFRNAEGPRCLALLVTRCTSSCVALRRIGRSGLAWRWTRDAGVRPGCECREPRPWRRIPTRAPYTSHAVILVSEMLTAGRTSDTRTYRHIHYQYIVSAERRQRQAFQQNLVHLLSRSPGKYAGARLWTGKVFLSPPRAPALCQRALRGGTCLVWFACAIWSLDIPTFTEDRVFGRVLK